MTDGVAQSDPEECREHGEPLSAGETTRPASRKTFMECSANSRVLRPILAEK